MPEGPKPAHHPAGERALLLHALAMVAAATFVAVAYSVIAYGHPHEDAYILFTYAENLAAGRGIVWWPGGGPAEGATDFLWLLALAGGSAALDASVPVVALAVNAAGIHLLTWILLSHATPAEPRVREGLFLLTIPVLVVLSPVAIAGYGGFSTPLFVALTLLLAHLVIRGTDRGIAATPAAGLALGLTRPEGVVVGIAFTALAFVRVQRGKRLRSLVVVTAVCLVAGLGYFLTRWLYFGLPLPLPAYVKIVGDPGLNGVRATAAWMGDQTWLLVLATGGFGWAVMRDRWLALAGLPFLAFGLALLFVLPVQDFAGRFHAPLTGAALLYGVALVGKLAEARDHLPATVRTMVPAAALGMLALLWVRPTTLHLEALTRGSWLDALPALLDDVVEPDDAVALTEAGRLGYWLDAELYDLVGLNTPHTAVFGVDANYLEHIDPDVIFLHTTALRPFEGEGAVRWLSTARLESLRRPDVAGHGPNPTLRAGTVALDYVAERASEFATVVVFQAGEPRYLWALRPESVSPGAFARALEEAFNLAGRCSYLEMRRDSCAARRVPVEAVGGPVFDTPFP